MPLVPVAELLRAEGALSPEDVLRWLPGACDALSKLAASGVTSGITPDSLRVSRDERDVEIAPVPLSGGPREQVRAIAALAYELLKGLPPPESPAADAWVGVRPELVRVLAPALLGNGAGDLVALALQLRALGKGGTAHYVQPAKPAGDTLLSAKPQVAPAIDRSGEVLGAYELTRFLGEGGMGEVYLARHVRLGREVAIKLLKPELAAHPEIVQRFFQEARVVNEINHPHIVQILDFVEEPGRVYCVMELLAGHTLAELAVQQGPLGLARVCTIMAQVCDALHAAHQRGVVHRDVKPENIFVTRATDGADFVKVLDFGIARRTTESNRTQQGVVLGTPHYMAPEQAAGRPVDARTDLYAVGLALFETLSNQSVMAVTPTPVNRTARGEEVPPALTRLIASCLELDPARRPESAAHVALALRGFATPPAPRAPAPVPTAELAAPRSKAPFAGLGVAVVAIVAVVVGMTASSSDNEAPVPEPVIDAQPVKTSVVLPPKPAEPAVQPPPVAPPAAKKAPVKVKTTAPTEAPEVKRAAELRRRYDALVAKHGLQQLTTIERTAIQHALASTTATALDDAEGALADAEARLGR